MSENKDISSGRKVWERFFADDHDNLSSMRLMSLLALVFSGVLASASVWGNADGNSELVLYFLVAAFAPKAVQKFAQRG